ncbi:MAG: hypothetical protein M3132_15035 [Actinomycetia bacterium]|nr:hypothetical protein [Actinomycetes bacterium]
MKRERISNGRAALSAVGIVLYFAIFTAWVPSMLARSSFLSTAPRNVADGIVLVVWTGFLFAGVGALRWAQDREMI